MSHPFDRMGDVREWAPPGWHWELSPVGARSLVRNLGPVVDPDLLCWRSRGLGAVRREAAPEEVVRRRIWEEDEHVRRYLYLLDRSPDRGWSILQGSHISYDPVSIPHLWFVSIHGSAPGQRWLFVIVLVDYLFLYCYVPFVMCYVTGGLFIVDLYILLYCICLMLLIYIYFVIYFLSFFCIS
jgi:hypothetical protein